MKIGGLVVILLSAALSPAGQVSSPPPSSQTMIGQPAPGFTLTSLGGTVVRLSDYARKFVVVHFAADW